MTQPRVHELRFTMYDSIDVTVLIQSRPPQEPITNYTAAEVRTAVENAVANLLVTGDISDV